uniref:Solute carrier family 25 member 30 n=1 Tax=Astatotilapia calliptera TaxID=8154 RepID=A0AAX7UE08_ASTCA
MSNVNWKPFVFGGLASVTAECGTFPIDLAKTRLQVQGQVGDSKYREIRYRGMLHAIMRIGREEGLRALYSGIAPAMLRQASYGTIKIGTYQSFKRLLVERPEDETLLTNVLCGILSGVISSSIANPTDVLKIRMQAQGNVIQGSMMGNFINIYQEEGTRGLWKGVSLTAQRAAIVVGVELPVYDLTKKHLILSGYMGDTVYTHFFYFRMSAQSCSDAKFVPARDFSDCIYSSKCHVQLCVRLGGGSGIKSSGRGPDTHDEPERRSAVPGNIRLSAADVAL